MKKKVIVTGVTGFVGSAITKKLLETSFNVLGLRHHSLASVPNNDCGCYDELTLDLCNPNLRLKDALKGVDIVIHCAGVSRNPKTRKDRALCRELNLDATVRMANEASSSGVKLFVFFSTMKVYGGNNEIPLTEKTKVSPQDVYSQLKYEAELKLLHISKRSSMKVVILRCPFIYGDSIPGSIGTLKSMVSLGIPLPIGYCTAKRSSLGIENLTDAVLKIVRLDAPVKSGIFLITDDEDLSLKDFLNKICARPCRVWNLNLEMLGTIFRLMGLTKLFLRLVQSTEADITKVKEAFRWSPPYSVDEHTERLRTLS
jgi:nucleoside-diphosphate-sugar epimerase